MTRLLYVITGLGTGGAEMMLVNLLRHIDRTRFEPQVISLSRPAEMASRISALGIPVHSVEMRGRIPDVPGFWRLVRRIKNSKPDVVHTWMYHADLIGGLAARLAGVKSIAWCIRNSDLDPEKTKAATRVIVAVCAFLSRRLPRRIVSCSEQARRIHIAKGYDATKMLVIPNGFDLSRFQPDPQARLDVRRELGIAQDAPLVGLIGRFDPQKNHLGFLKAARILKDRLPCVHFLFAGKDVDSGNSFLSRTAKEFGLTERCHFLGLRVDVARLMASLDVLALCSIYGEAFPNVLGEAMACGIPCVVTRAGDSEWIVGDCGRVVAVGDLSGFAKALQEILELSAQQRMDLGIQARLRCAGMFEIGKVVARYEQVYERLAHA